MKRADEYMGIIGRNVITVNCPSNISSACENRNFPRMWCIKLSDEISVSSHNNTKVFSRFNSTYLHKKIW